VLSEIDTPVADDDAAFSEQMTALIPSLRAFARGLCRDATFADDLVQEALVRAWSGRATFTPGSNFRAWMFTILRNHFYNVAARNARMVAADPELVERVLVQEPTQEQGLALHDVERAMAQLPAQQREVLLLVAGAGMSYEEAADVAGCNMGTLKSRLNRARLAIRAIIDGPDCEQASVPARVR
jgi:RNA polymerase sigma-70 factor (ECF subfamily)